MIENRLEEAKKELDLLIKEGASREKVYNMSVKIDKLLLEYYQKYKLGEITK